MTVIGCSLSFEPISWVSTPHTLEGFQSTVACTKTWKHGCSDTLATLLDKISNSISLFPIFGFRVKRKSCTHFILIGDKLFVDEAGNT
jgi:hypothetical protein